MTQQDDARIMLGIALGMVLGEEPDRVRNGSILWTWNAERVALVDTGGSNFSLFFTQSLGEEMTRKLYDFACGYHMAIIPVESPDEVERQMETPCDE